MYPVRWTFVCPVVGTVPAHHDLRAPKGRSLVDSDQSAAAVETPLRMARPFLTVQLVVLVLVEDVLLILILPSPPFSIACVQRLFLVLSLFHLISP